MRTYPFNILLVLGALGSVNASAQLQGKLDTSNVKEIRLNPGAALGDDVQADDIFSSIEYIPLETNKNSLFGKIDHLEILDSYFIIQDDRTVLTQGQMIGSILIFDKDGKFRARIDRNGLKNFTVDPIKKEIVVLEELGRDVAYYNLEGKQLRKEKPAFYYWQMYFLNNGKSLYWRDYDVPEKGTPDYGKSQFNRLLMVNNDHSIYKSYMPIDTAKIHVTFPFGEFNYLTKSGNEVFYRPPLSFDLCSFQGDQMVKQYRFIFPLNVTVSPEIYSWPDEKRHQYYNDHPRSIYNMVNVYKTGNILSFTLPGADHGSNQLFFYNLKNKLLTACGAVKTNNTNLLVPLTNPVIASDGVQLYTWLRSAPFFSQKRSYATIKVDTALANKFKKVGPKALDIDLAEQYKGRSEKLGKFLKQGSAKDNPILIVLKVI